MDETNKRFKELREALNKSQEQMGKILGISKSGVSDIETGRRKVTQQHVIMLENYSERPINGDWLLYGTGDMFVELPEEDEYFKAATLICKNGDELAMKAIIEYWKLDSKSKKLFWDYLKKITS